MQGAGLLPISPLATTASAYQTATSCRQLDPRLGWGGERVPDVRKRLSGAESSDKAFEITTAEYMTAQNCCRYKYEVMSENSPYFGNVDFLFSDGASPTSQHLSGAPEPGSRLSADRRSKSASSARLVGRLSPPKPTLGSGVVPVRQVDMATG